MKHSGISYIETLVHEKPDGSRARVSTIGNVMYMIQRLLWDSNSSWVKLKLHNMIVFDGYKHMECLGGMSLQSFLTNGYFVYPCNAGYPS